FRIETDFADYYDRFYQAVRGGGTLKDIELLRNGMVVSVRNAIHEVFKVQGWFIAFCCLFGPALLESLGCHPIHAQLFRVLTVGVGLLVLVLAMLNVFFYLDNREAAMKTCGVFAFVNLFGTLITLWLGPQTFGYGFVCAGACTSIYALRLLHRQFDQLEFETFMLRN
ncbi:MAG: exopolysaccharide Pel transporter PelG, partial [Planctomycetota bacterium]